MFLQEAIRARVASSLRPWTEEEPRFELELGLLRSRATARDLLLKPGSLNSLLDESSALCFESIRIGEVVVHFSLLSSPLLKIEARGIRFDLKFRGGDRKWKSDSSTEARKKERIEWLDPEGISLHNALENILKARRPGSSIMDSLTAVILGNCQVWLNDIDFQIQIPIDYEGSAQIDASNKLYFLALNIGESNAIGQVTGYYKLLKSIFEVLIMGRDAAHLVFSFKDLCVKLKQSDENYPTSCILFMRSLSLSVGMKKLHPLEFEIDVPEVDVKLSYGDLFVVILFYAMLNTENGTIASSDYNLRLVGEVKGTRSGRMLWKTAACQMHNLLPSFRLQRLVNLVLVWCQYVKLYESLLKQVGYPAADLFSTVRSRLSKDARFSNQIQHLWREVTETENGLPAEGVALARRIARHRVTVSSRIKLESSDDTRTSFPSFALIFIPSLLKGIGLIVHFFIFILHKMIHAFYCLYRLVWSGHVLQWNTENEEQNLLPEEIVHAIDKPGLVEGNQHILFTLSKFVVNIVPGDLPHVNIGGSLAKPLPVDLLALRVMFNQLYLDFAADDNMHQLTFACGELVSHSYSLSGAHEGLDVQTEKVEPVKGYVTEKHNHGYAQKAILSSSPAMQISMLELGYQSSFSSDSIGFLKDHINEMYLEWKSSYGFSKLKHVSTLAQPFILCRLKSFIINPCCTAPNFGLLKLGLSMGKLTCELDISLFIGIYSQIIQLGEHAFFTGKALSWGAISKSFHNRELQTDAIFDPDVYADKPKMWISRIIFDKQVVIGAAIVGPRIKVSFPAECSPISGTHGFRHVTPRGLECDIVVDLKDIYSAVWSVRGSVSTASEKEEDNGSGTCPYKWLKKPPVVHIPEANTDESFIVQGQLGHNLFLKLEGLSLFLESVMENQQQNILKPVSLTLESSYYRKYLHSLATVVTVLSMALVGSTTDLIISLCMDKLEEVFQVLGGSLNAVSHISSAYSISNRDDLPHGIAPVQGMGATQYKYAAVDSQQCFDSFIVNDTKFVMDINLEFRPLDIILDNYRNLVGHTAVAASAPGPSKKMLVFPNAGAEFCIKKSSLNFFWEERISVSLLLELAGIRSLIFGNKIESPCEVLMKNELSDDSDVSCEVSLLSCSFSLQSGVNGHAVASGQDTEGNVVSSGRFSCRDLDTMQSPHFLYSDNSHPIDGSYGSKLSPDSSWKFSWLPSSTCWILIRLQLSEISVVENSAKLVDVVKDGCHADMNNLEAVVAVGKECSAISSEIQGGLFLLETKSVVVYVSSIQAYALFFSSLLSYFPSSEVSDPKSSPRIKTSKYLNPGASMALQLNRDGPEYDSSHAPSLDMHGTLLEVGSKSLKVITVRISQISIKFIIMDACVGVRELDIETNFLFKYEENTTRNFFFDLSRFAILGLHWGRTNNYKEMGAQAPRFRSSILTNTETTVGLGQPCHAFQVPEINSSDSQAPGKKLLVNGEGFCFYSLISQNVILKCMTASAMIDKELPGTMAGSATPKDGWGGSASVSGLDMMITIPEIQMLLSLFDDLRNVSAYDSSEISKEEIKFTTEGGNDGLEDIISNGVVVAVKDLDQHMYLTVELVENNHHLVGAAHYSLVGERALFRVQCCTQRKRFASVSCFSLISLYAKNDMGEPLRVNFKQSSNLVDISGTDDKGGALWQAIPYRPASYEGNDELETYNHSMEKAFYLLNCKSDLGVAFVDRLPLFVKKPGSLFKMKILSTSPRVQRINLAEASSSYLCNTSDTNIQRHVAQDINARHVNILIERVGLTIHHEVSDANDNLPLLRVSINNIQCVIQALYSKTRLITNFRIMMENYDCSSSIWREVVLPVEICMFSRFNVHLEARKKTVPFHFHCSIPKIEVSLCQFSLDVILFLIGKLGLAGPYIVRHPIVLGNCCKVKNFSGANLLCRVENHDTIIPPKQSASVVLRPVSRTKRNPHGIPSISLQLLLGEYFTSPVHISHLNTDRCAWKTRLASHDDSRTFPGPFVVVETAKKSEDGISIAVYPMLIIHNQSGLSLDLRCRRPRETEDEFATVLLRHGDSIDDSVAAFESLSMSGLMKKALTSLSLGNFLVSIRPEASEVLGGPSNLVTVEWSEDLKGGKPVCLSGLFDKLSYQLKKGFGGKSQKVTFSSIKCRVQSQESFSYIHFLVQSIGRDVPVLRPPKASSASHLSTSPIAVQEQKEIYLLPTVQVYNVLQSEIHVMLSENVEDNNKSSLHTGRQAIIASGSSACFYVNPSIIYFTFALTELGLKCKPINSSDMMKKLNPSMSEFHYLDKELDFGGGKFISNLRFSRGDRGTLEVTIFTSSILRNATEISFFCCDANNKSISREDPARYWSTCSPELGFVLDPGSTASWFFRSNKVRLLWLKDKVADALLDLDALSGFTEIGSELLSEVGVKHVMKFGISLKPISSKVIVPSRLVHIVPRYVVSNESDVDIYVRQCCLHSDDVDGVTVVTSHQKSALQMQISRRKRKTDIIDTMFRSHSNSSDDSMYFTQFCLKQDGWSWSGPVCVTSLGHFFLRFRRKPIVLGNGEPDYKTETDNGLARVGTVDIEEEESTLVMHFRLPSDIILPYRIENHLNNSPIMYHQKGIMDPETLASGTKVGYAWDDLSLPHMLIVRIPDMNLEREINIDKLSSWKPFYKARQGNSFMLHPLYTGVRDTKRTGYEASSSVPGIFRITYKVYADGSQRVLRIGERVDTNGSHLFHQHSTMQKKIEFRLSFFGIRLLEDSNQDVGEREASDYLVFLQARMENICLRSLFANRQAFNVMRVQSLNVDEKWQGAPFAALLRRHQLDNNDATDQILSIIIVFQSGNSSVTEVKYCSIIIQPLDLNFDEETVMKLVPFWRTSLSDPNSTRQQIYFKHFEIHPIKIIASFLPGNLSTSYSTSQEALRSFLHNVIKVPTVKAAVVELNGVLLTHALLTTRELLIKCMQHYSWYAMRAIYIAKGSSLLPPSFASIFDDSAFSSLDVFFDPSSSLHSLPGLTVGALKFIRKSIDGKGIFGTKRYLGDLGKTLRRAGSNILFVAITEISDSVLRGAETSGFSGMVKGFHQGILNLAMEPTLIGSAFMEGGPSRRIKLDQSPGINEAYVEGYLQAMLDALYKLEYLKVRVIDDEVLLKNLPPNSSLIGDIVEHVKAFLIREGLLKGESNASASLSTRRLYGGQEWKFGPMLLTLAEHLFVSFAIRLLRKQASKVVDHVRNMRKGAGAIVPKPSEEDKKEASKKQALGKFVLLSILAYIDGRLCRCIPNAIARRIVSGFLLSFLDENDKR